MFERLPLRKVLRRSILLPLATMAFGITVGLAYAWLVNPLQYEIAAPAQSVTDIPEGQATEQFSSQETGAAGGVPPVVFVCGVPVGLIALVGFFVFVFRPRTRRKSTSSINTQEEATEIPTAMVPEREGPEEAQPVLVTEPLATFKAGYGLGNESFQKEFRIVAPDGKRLGRCGVKISDVYSEGPPRLVSAFEVALHDKDETRTFNKVLMSRHAYNDETTRTRLAGRGEPELAQSDKVFNLETISLRLEVHITEMAYGEGASPPQSFFERLKLELSVYQKSG